MATTTRVLDANVNGTVYTSNANSALEALDTCHSGATAPTDEVANGKLWLDTSTTPGILKIYNNATWEVVVNTTNVTASGALMDSELTDIASVKALDQGVATADSPTFAGLTVNGNNYPSAGPLSNRNLIINGAMNVAQRGTSSSPAPSGYLIDRFATFKSGAGLFSLSQSSDAPAGFSNSFLATVTTTSSPTAGEYYIIQQVIEGNNFSVLAQGTSEAKTFTLSFQVKSSILGTFSGSIRDGVEGTSYVFEYTVNTINTWETKSITIAGNTSGTFATGSTAGAKVNFSLGLGTTLATATVGSWVAGNFLGSTTETDFIANAGATLQITGVQLEVGDTATPFEHRSYGQELALCQRYYTKIGPSGAYTRFGTGVNPSTTTNSGFVTLPTTMRAVGTLTGSPSTTFAVYNGVSVFGCSSSAIDSGGSSLNAVTIELTTSGLTAGGVGQMIANNDASAYIAMDAEL